MSHNGENLRAIMAEQGLTEQALAERIGHHYKAIAHFKRTKTFRKPTLRKLAKALNVTQKRLAGEDGNGQE
jgi:transcriptional regulator with XRE-family HTH domain